MLSTGESATVAEAANGATPTVAEAEAFVRDVDAELRKLWVAQARADWVNQTYIIEDSEALSARANELVMEFLARKQKEAARFDGLDLPEAVKRQLWLLRIATPLPAPSNPAERAELAEIATAMGSAYGKGKYCPERLKGECLDLQKLGKIMDTSRNYDELLDAWQGWHSISPPYREKYQRYVDLANKGAREVGFKDLGALWRSGYDMPPDEFEKETDRLWQQVKPLYDELHCYVRSQLAKHYGADKVESGKPIPAHVLGNMWAQQWGNVYPMVEPYKGQGSLDVTKALEKQKYDAKKMVKLGEKFFTSLGMNPLPETFWKRSMLTQPADRDVVCHASAWDVTFNNDLRIKMCIRPTEDDLVTIHHELGHNYYYNNYYTLPVLFQAGANDGFHEGIGDTLALSVTPQYLKDLGLLTEVPKGEKARINFLMKQALDKIAFLPFGKLIDQWRWDVFSGKTPKDKYNEAWWALREKYQGVKAPSARSERDFDAGAKYHVPGNVPYTRYFLARIYQFQFHRALCEVSGHKGPLTECSIYGSKPAGDKLKAMLAMGASKPWPEAMKAITGSDKGDATAILDYFAPLRAYLAEQNKGQKCGW